MVSVKLTVRQSGVFYFYKSFIFDNDMLFWWEIGQFK